MKTMKALVLRENGPAIEEVDIPALRSHEVLTRVRACALNRVDLFMAGGHVHGGAGGYGNVLGVEWAGEVVETGAGVPGIKPGDRVMCSGAGGFAGYAKTDWGRVMPFPRESLLFEQAAAMPVALQTMHDAVVTKGRLAPGESVLIQGASSGVGLMGMQIAKAMGAGLVIGTSTRADRRSRLAEYGADLALDSSDPSWVEEVIKATGGLGVHLVVDQVSGPLMNQNMRAVRVLGRIVNVGRLGGGQDKFNFELHAMKRITYTGVTFRTRSHEEVREITRRVREDLWEKLSGGELLMPVDRVFLFEDVVEALAYMEADNHFGKVALKV